MTEVEKDSLLELANVLPLEDNTDFMFAYGSGAIAQKNQNTKDNMLDLIVVVKDTRKFHFENIQKNSSHYSLLRFFGADYLVRLQRNYAARVYFNTLVRVPNSNRLIKYGVVENGDLVSDLLDWDSLYISGRLQKPTVKLIENMSYNDPPTEGTHNLRMALDVNLKSAVHAALLLLPQTFSVTKLFQTICGLSYLGDFRTIIGEDKHKIENIVSNNLERFQLLYHPILDSINQVEISGSTVSQDLSFAAVHNHLELLPREVVWGIGRQKSKNKKEKNYNRDIEELIFSLAHQYDYPQVVGKALRDIVWRSSVRQSAKNALTAGVYKTLVYSSRKLLKMLRSFK